MKPAALKYLATGSPSLSDTKPYPPPGKTRIVGRFLKGRPSTAFSMSIGLRYAIFPLYSIFFISFVMSTVLHLLFGKNEFLLLNPFDKLGRGFKYNNIYFLELLRFIFRFRKMLLSEIAFLDCTVDVAFGIPLCGVIPLIVYFFTLAKTYADLNKGPLEID